MSSGNNNDFYKLTFAQREGMDELPEPMRLNHIPQKFKQAVWLAVDLVLDQASDEARKEGGIAGLAYYDIFSSEPNIGTILHDYEFELLEQFHDDISSYTRISDCRSFFKGLICDNTDDNYHRILTVIEFALRHEACPETLYDSLIDAFNGTPVAYFVEEIAGLPTIVPRISHEAGESTRQAIKVIQQGGLGGVSVHLRQAAEHINTEQYADAVADSISAVESVARQVAPEAKTLGQALKVLEKMEVITNQQLKDGFEKLYAYTNSEKGIRHALMDDARSNVGVDEAVFMFGACASFAAYLASKHRQMAQ